MEKKNIFRRIISDFITRELETPIRREVDVPMDIPKIISLLGPRRAGKTQILFYLYSKRDEKVILKRAFLPVGFSPLLETRG